MVSTKPLYLMISRTDTYMGRFIRVFCRYPYNHVSLTTDPELRQWYSFARYVQDTPLFGGYIREPVERFLAKTGDADVRIFRLDMAQQQIADLEQLFSKAGHPSMIYNQYDALASWFGGHIDIPNAYTCLGFASAVLGRRFHSIRELNKALEPYLYYNGALAALVPDSGRRDDPYFTRLGLLHGTSASAKQLGALSLRLIRHCYNSLKAHRSHSTVH